MISARRFPFPVSRLFVFMIITAVLASALALSGCAVRQQAQKPGGPGAAGADAPGAEVCWQTFRSVYGSRPASPGLLANASLSWRQGRKSARVILDLWGDFGGGSTPERYRMDAWSNLGGNLVYLLQDEQGLVAYYPDPPRIYTHQDPVRGALLLGLPFPFSLSDLAAVVVGDFSTLTPERYDAAEPGPNGTWIFTFASGPVETLTLDANPATGCRPEAMTGIASAPPGAPERGGPWSLLFSAYAEQAPELKDRLPELPERMDLALPGGAVGILRMKTRELTLAPWPEQAMVLTVPETAEARTLDGAPRDWTTGNIDQPEALPQDTQKETP